MLLLHLFSTEEKLLSWSISFAKMWHITNDVCGITNNMHSITNDVHSITKVSRLLHHSNIILSSGDKSQGFHLKRKGEMKVSLAWGENRE